MPPSVVIGIATKGRRDVLARTLPRLARQSTPPALIILAPSHRDADLPAALPTTLEDRIVICHDANGSCVQRNLILRVALERRADVVLFLDDDFLIADRFVAEVADVFTDRGVVGMSGTLILDGAMRAGHDVESACRLIEADEVRSHPRRLLALKTTYGCNMAFRLRTIGEHDVRFDENMPLYGWMEDRDFSARLGRFGRIVRSTACRGIHLAVSNGRTSGTRFGYSQVANPIYIYRQGQMSIGWLLRSVVGNCLANLLRSVAPERDVDRRGRMRGNLLAVLDLVTARLHPRRILDLQ